MKPIFGFGLCLICVVAWWGALFPEFCVRSGVCSIYDEHGNNVTNDFTEQEILSIIKSAKAGEVQYKSVFIEALTRTDVDKKNITQGGRNDDQRGNDNHKRITERGRGITGPH